MVCVTLILGCYLKLYLRLKWRVSPNRCWIGFPISNKLYLVLVFYQKLYIIIFDFFLDMNQCLYNPCQNGGTFTQNDGCFTWTCKDGYVGTLCNEGKHISPPPPLCKRKYLALVFLFISSTHELNVDVYPLLFMCVCIFLLLGHMFPSYVWS